MTAATPERARPAAAPPPSTYPARPWDADDPGPITSVPHRRALRLTAVADIAYRPIKWLWATPTGGRLALGTLALLGGREGIGKSTLAYDLAARVTRGQLPGANFGTPKGVVVVASEDPWEQVIRPRLMAAGADLERVFRVEVDTSDDVPSGLSLPDDIPALGGELRAADAVLVILDPLLSRLDAGLDTHKDAEVRRALEPLVALAERTNAVVLGLIHVNKSMSTDPLSLLMGSRAFPAVARAVLFLMVDPDDETVRLLGQPKNNLGRVDLPTLRLRIESITVGETDDGPVTASRVVYAGETNRSIREAIAEAGDGAESRTAAGEAAMWLADYLASVGGCIQSAIVKQEARKAGIAEATLERARRRAQVSSEARGFPRRSYWFLPGRAPGESDATDAIEAIEATGPVASVASVASTPRARTRDGLRAD